MVLCFVIFGLGSKSSGKIIIFFEWLDQKGSGTYLYILEVQYIPQEEKECPIAPPTKGYRSPIRLH